MVVAVVVVVRLQALHSCQVGVGTDFRVRVGLGLQGQGGVDHGESHDRLWSSLEVGVGVVLGLGSFLE